MEFPLDTPARIGENEGMNESIAHDAQGNPIAVIRMGCVGPNPKCKHASRMNRTIHIIPDHRDPRAENAHLALNTYHYASRGDALESLEIAWNTAITVDNARDRDAAYKRGESVIILKSGKYI